MSLAIKVTSLAPAANGGARHAKQLRGLGDVEIAHRIWVQIGAWPSEVLWQVSKAFSEKASDIGDYPDSDRGVNHGTVDSNDSLDKVEIPGQYVPSGFTITRSWEGS